MKSKTAIIIPDTHIPYHDVRAYKLMLKVAKAAQPDEVVILGDFGEFASVGSHPKDPDLNNKLEFEIGETNQALDELDHLFPKATKVFIEGNHEHRLTRFIRDKAPELFGLVDARRLLNIHSRRNWRWVPYTPDQKYRVLNSHLYARHEPKGGGEHVAASTVKKGGKSVIFGHVHRIQEFQTVDMEGNNYRGITCGWLGNQKHKIFNYVKDHHQWALGFTVVKVLEDKSFYAQTVHIINYRCVYGDKLYVG